MNEETCIETKTEVSAMATAEGYFGDQHAMRVGICELRSASSYTK